MKITLSPEMTIIISEGEYNFEGILEAIECSRRVFLATYNLAKNTQTSKIIKKIKNSSAKTIIISSIPEDKQKIDDKDKAEAYKRYYDSFIDDFELEHYINLRNHAKIIITDSCSYIGSANFSEGTKNSIEAGLIINSENLSRKLWENVVPYYLEHENSIYLGDYKALKKFHKNINEYNVELSGYIYELEVLMQCIDMEEEVEFPPNNFVEIYDLLYKIERSSWEDYYYILNGKVDSIDDDDDGYNHFYDSRCQAEKGNFLYNQAEEGEFDFKDLASFVRDLKRDSEYLHRMYLKIKNRVEKLEAIAERIVID
ncbi:phospholipase D-like domain-containing protein [Bacillus thuringiensis]|uniref:PLD phosphodiesterase domain-containing protein n=1 Tax=Bacillus thuringiensis subsp. jegathesan TaxID=56955 RepID=A0A9X6M7U2_BACTJ|nr:phospholipase D-like domain-containing protein [Bacillus thuringiensis]OUB69898.1 hypothetical protein BK750_13040 [Bacillus thuringiensis serovar jegathesan]